MSRLRRGTEPVTRSHRRSRQRTVYPTEEVDSAKLFATAVLTFLSSRVMTSWVFQELLRLTHDEDGAVRFVRDAFADAAKRGEAV